MIFKDHWYENAADFAKKHFPWMVPKNKKTREKIGKIFPQDYIDNLQFSGLNVEPYDILLLSYVGAFLTILFCLFMDIIIILLHGPLIGSIDTFTILLILLVTIILPIFILNLLVTYPKTYARYIKIHSLGDIPEVLSYLVMYLKLVPNLENSVKFAATESKTTLGHDLRKMMWNMEIKIYHGIDEALTEFATQWGKWCDYFKRSLHLIRNSVREADHASRIVTLDRAIDVSLDGTRELMIKFANKLHQPTMVIYSIGIMIPLSLVAMLPATKLVGLNITIFQVFLIYDILLPVLIFYYTRKILLSRPATFNPPVIPSDHPEVSHINKSKRLTVSLSLGGFIALPGIFFLIIPLVLPDGSSNDILNFIARSDGLNSFFPVTLFIIWGITACIASYCLSVYYPYKKVRDDIKQIEMEFSDALYILGKRLSEEKSPEECFMHASETMRGSKIADIFNHTGFNLTAMHTNLRDALFSFEFGSLKHVYSDRLKAIMLLFVEGIRKSQHAVSISMVRIADHLKELQAVETKIKETLFELTSTLRSTAALFAPMIGGITLAINKLIADILFSMAGQMPGIPEDINTPSTIVTATEAFAVGNVRPEYFVLVIGIYIIELLFLLVKFTNGIDNGDDKSAFMYTLGTAMPVSILVFSITVIIGQIMFSQMIQV